MKTTRSFSGSSQEQRTVKVKQAILVICNNICIMTRASEPKDTYTLVRGQPALSISCWLLCHMHVQYEGRARLPVEIEYLKSKKTKEKHKILFSLLLKKASHAGTGAYHQSPYLTAYRYL
jgi:hypothetical protein